MYKKYINFNAKIVSMFRTIIFCIFIIVSLFSLCDFSERRHTPIVISYENNHNRDIFWKRYTFSTAQYTISFTDNSWAITESRHSGDKKVSIEEMREFLSTTSYQQSLERSSDTNCWYKIFTGTYLSDPYSWKHNYSREDITKLTDQQIIDAYNGTGIRAELWDVDFYPYPVFSILPYPIDCFPISSISYATNDGYAINFYIYTHKYAKHMQRIWKNSYESYKFIWKTLDWYNMYELWAAIWSTEYYIKLDNGDILTTGYKNYWDIRISHKNE